MTPQLKLSFLLCVCGDHDCTVPNGQCHCGCGRNVVVAQKTDRRKGQVKGQFGRFVSGHNKRQHPIIETAAPFKINGVYCRVIHLSSAQFTIVDAADYEWLMQWKWSASWSMHTKTFYAVRGGPPMIRMARLILGMEPSDKLHVDHISGSTLDNRRKNLRPATNSQNMMNACTFSNNKSGRKGVCYRPQMRKWGSTIRFAGRSIHLGLRSDFAEACKLREDAEKLYYGEFAGGQDR